VCLLIEDPTDCPKKKTRGKGKLEKNQKKKRWRDRERECGVSKKPEDGLQEKLGEVK
jgi:hypothetical protein